jgi:hypothetical protein
MRLQDIRPLLAEITLGLLIVAICAPGVIWRLIQVRGLFA